VSCGPIYDIKLSAKINTIQHTGNQ